MSAKDAKHKFIGALRWLASWGAQLIAVAAVLAASFAAYNLGAASKDGSEPPTVQSADSHAGHAHDTEAAGESAGETIWTCSMHPQIRMSEPGDCPICGMELIPAVDEASAKPTPKSASSPAASSSKPMPEPEPAGWACAMNCLPPLPEPGSCPICGMDMVPIFDDAGGGGSDDGSRRRLVMSREAEALADIQTSPVERRWVENIVRAVGYLDYDETRLSHVAAYVGGRIDELYIDYEGVLVREGDHMAYLYSPDLLTAQEELLQAKRAAESLASGSASGSAKKALEAARERLRLWGLQPEQIQALEERGEREDHITIHAPVGGVVIEKNVREGGYVKTGDRLYMIADLSRLWLELKAYESDLLWLRYGQDVAFETEAYPGKTFHGRISFIAPTLDPMTRTVDVRVNVENADGDLKPGMFARARIKSRLAKGGKAIEPDLAGKWISPMHPEVVSDGPGDCPVCGMDLVPAAELGFVAAVEDKPPLVIPVSAPLITGKRAVVYVEVPEAERPTYEGREIVLGPRAGDYYLVMEGLREGERVATQGAFKIDAALQIVAKPSMMNPEGGRSMSGHDHGGMDMPAEGSKPGAASKPTSQPASRPAAEPLEPFEVSQEFLLSLAPTYDAYFLAQKALAGDNLEGAKEAFKKLHHAINALSGEGLPEHPASACLAQSETLMEAAVEGRLASSFDEARGAFETASAAVLEMQRLFGHAGEAAHYKIHCPMAFDWKGASWLQASEEVRNPYFGFEMLVCGKAEQTFEPKNATNGGVEQ